MRNEKFSATNFACLIDNYETEKQLPESFINKLIQVYIDLKTGMNLTGRAEKAFAFYKDCVSLKGIEIIGLTLPRIEFLNVSNAKAIRRSEDHLVVEVADMDRYKVGERWYGVRNQICPTVPLYYDEGV